ncbi:hypothetical protein GOODEAATRI_017642, partial [Goodea atripinnis]
RVQLCLTVFYFSVSAPCIAVVGAGIGGTAAAYYLREQFGPVVKIDVFESGTVGGRLATVKLGDYECPNAAVNPAIDRIYQYQQYGYSFSSVDKLLHAMGGNSFLTLMNQTLEEAMLGEGFSQVFLNDIVAPVTRVNFGQSGKSDITFSGFSPPIPTHYPGLYHRLAATLVHGTLNVSYLGTTEPASEFTVSDVLTTDSKGCAINSLSSLDPVHIPDGYKRPSASHPKVWKAFSSESLTQEQLQQMFLSYDSVSETVWLAYPSYRPLHRKTPPFVLHNRLYYLNPLEWAASCMEMSAISARNVALLAHHRWHEQAGKIDQEDLHTRLRGEL